MTPATRTWGRERLIAQAEAGAMLLAVARSVRHSSDGAVTRNKASGLAAAETAETAETAAAESVHNNRAAGRLQQQQRELDLAEKGQQRLHQLPRRVRDERFARALQLPLQRLAHKQARAHTNAAASMLLAPPRRQRDVTLRESTWLRMMRGRL